MRVFVTGGAGYIGSVCVEELVKAGYEVAVFDNFSEGHKSAIHEDATLYTGDLRTDGDVSDAMGQFKPDAVMHFAGRALVPESMKDPSIYYNINVRGGLNLLDAMVEHDCKNIVFSSTCATYGLPDKVPIDERTPQSPINPYGHSKLLYEQILKWYEKIHGVNFTALRYFNAAGASERFGEHHRIETHLIPNVLKVALGQSEKCFIFGDKNPTPDGTCIRDFIHIIDLAAAHIKALHREESGFFNLGTGEGFSVLQVIDVARRVTGHEIPVEYKEGRPGDPPRLVAAAHAAKRALGWEPQFMRLQDIIESAWQWHVKNPDGYAD